MPTIPGFESHFSNIGDVRLHYMLGGPADGKPLMLVHGWPETWWAWHKLMPLFVNQGYRVMVPDMRGFGDSSRPEDGYDRMTMAEDLRALARSVWGDRQVALVGHDWGGSTVAAWAGKYPGEVTRLVVIEAEPRGPWSGPVPWFYNLHAAPGLPEMLTAGKEREYLTYFYRSFAADPAAISPAGIDVYLRTYGSPDGMKVAFALVRALSRDVESNAAAAKHPANIPVLAIGGGKSMGTKVAKALRPLFIQVQEYVFPNAGHFIPEEKSQELFTVVDNFLQNQTKHMPRQPNTSDRLDRAATENPPGQVEEDGQPWPQIQTPEQLLLIANAQNLVARWQNIIVRAKSGEEQLRWMRESGVFANDIKLTFRMPDGQVLAFTGLGDEPLEFYTTFLRNLKKPRANLAANVEVLAWGEDALRFRFRYVITMGNQPSLIGDNDATMRRVDGRYQLTRSTIDVTLFDAAHAY